MRMQAPTSKSDSFMTHSEFELESNPNAINEVENIIDEFNRKLKFKEDVFGNIMVAVTEAVNNAIYHGNAGNQQKKVHLCFDLSSSYKLIVKVRDEGPGFDIDNLPDPTAPENIDKPGGRGVFLMRHLSDDLFFNKEGREAVMTFNI